LAPAFLPANGLPAGDLVRIDPADGSTLGGDSFDGPAHLTVAVADGVPAVMTFRVDPVGLVEVDWKYRVTNVSSLGIAPARRFAVSAGHILWTWGSAAVGYSPDCEPWPPDFPAPDPGCQPDWVTTLDGTLQPPAAIGPEQVVYVGSGGAVAVLDVATGVVAWTANVGGGVATPPVVAGETVLVATTNGRLVALPAAGCGAATCIPLWEGQLGGTPSSAPAAGGDVAYVGTEEGDVVAFASDGCGTATCAPLARLDVGAEITGGPIVHDARVTVATADGRLVAYGLSDYGLSCGSGCADRRVRGVARRTGTPQRTPSGFKVARCGERRHLAVEACAMVRRTGPKP
jgi:outer membrane protein assembly factor BamB